MKSNLTSEQIIELLKPIEESRVGKDGKGFSHVAAWDIRKRMIQIFGPANWSSEVLEMELIYESVDESGPRPRYSVAYRARCEVTVGQHVYSEWAAGDATNYPSRADAHDQAIKTAESQAFKRACVNLGDQFGLSLYKDGSTEATVGQIVGQEHADAISVPIWLSSFSQADGLPALDLVASEIKYADISKSDRDMLLASFKTAKARIWGTEGEQ